MTRRETLTAVELAAVATALGASLPILAHAVNYGVSWAGPALFGALVLTMILAAVAPSLLMVGIWQWGQRMRERADVPPSARGLLWPDRDPVEIQAWDRDNPEPPQDAYEAARRARYGPTSTGAAGRHSAPVPDVPKLPPTLPMPTVDLAAWGVHEAGGVR